MASMKVPIGLVPSMSSECWNEMQKDFSLGKLFSRYFDYAKLQYFGVSLIYLVDAKKSRKID